MLLQKKCLIGLVFSMTFCFVILHYKTSEDTIECIQSIQNLNEKAKIVVVDNASNNGSIEKVETIFSENSDIYFIKNAENLGFAEGNNIGYQFAKHTLNADFIAINNNDTLVESADFIRNFVTLYEEKKYHVAGPDIESLVDHKHQNPKKDTVPGLKKAKKEIWRYRILYLLSRLGLYEKLKGRGPIRDTQKTPIKIPSCVTENVMLHGSFVVFSPAFIREEEYSFRPGTFLYMEEPILYRYCRLKNYKMVFNPYVKVFHKEDSSTNSLFSATKAKREFVFKNMIKSLKVYCSVLAQ